ncbi:GGDEF domain-containing protein [Azospirillum sp. YIM B02556]|uniref:diguanylate cyclase n=1 Tax=Azospirillum endophyticum TaxID=2800326 RepID=A0ABS1FFW0_9PROT|nr:diguanylate cyclase [Azospirillum endophyticum]MBK1842326.1 GGDEF domain-containing protein [Azospirillum endophyticum]
MRQRNLHFTDVATLSDALSSSDIREQGARARSILVQIFSAPTDRQWIETVAGEALRALPKAVVIGATTVGEVADGRTVVGTTTLALSFFDSTDLVPVAFACEPGEEHAAGSRIGRAAAGGGEPPAGLLLLATPLSLDAAQLLRGIADTAADVPVFGGGAGDYAVMGRSLVSLGTTCFERGAVAVLFFGSALAIERRTYLGWQPLSREMTVTGVEGTLVRTVDDGPAFDIYRRYLGIPDDRNFFLNGLEFPFLFQRDGQELARVPIAVEPGGALRFVADIGVGETFRLGYGNPSMIVAEARTIQDTMSRFAPEAVFLYTCGCRRFLMQEDADLETAPFQTIAPTAGFYTYGEFFGQGHGLHLLNSTMVAVGMREGPRIAQGAAVPPAAELPAEVADPYANKHSRVVSHLVHFIDAVTRDLEASNRELTRLSITDKLTQLSNRAMLDVTLDKEISRSNRHGETFSVILIDIDHFKQVNDRHGHNVGDAVIVHVAQVMKRMLRDCDTFGRWGGEEFLAILPNTPSDKAEQVAETMRKAVQESRVPVVDSKTVSLGVTSFRIGDTPALLVGRADKALYGAKIAGRNRVVRL